MQGFELFDKPMVLDYARTKSDATVKKEGIPEELEAHKRRRLAEKGTFGLFLRFSFKLMYSAQSESKLPKQPKPKRN